MFSKAVSQTEAERSLPADDAVATPIVFVRSEEVHRTALALRATGLLAIHFRHALVHAHADGERVAVIAVGGDEMIVLSGKGNRSDGDRFLADVKVEETAHATGLVILQRSLFESADANHLSEKLNFPFGGE